MTTSEEDKIELIERQIAEKVTSRVRAELFKLYAAIAFAVGAVLTYVGFDIKSEIVNDTVEKIEKEIDGERSEIERLTIESKVLAKDSNDVIQQTKKLLREFQPEAENLKVTIERVNSINRSAQNLSDSYERELQPMLEGVKSLSDQVKELALQVDSLNMRATTEKTNISISDKSSLQTISNNIENIIEKTKETEKSIESASKKTTVFLQFAVGTREQAHEISQTLALGEFIIPEPDRTEAALNKYEVRYFYDDDKEAAERLANSANKILNDLGYSKDENSNIEPKSFVDFTGKKPRQGVIELWLEIPIKLNASEKYKDQSDKNA